MAIKQLILLPLFMLCPLLAAAQTDTDEPQDSDTTEETTDSTTTATSYIEIPNGFSPNDDGINEVLRVTKQANIVEFRAIIFNRWGQKLYEWTDINGSWDGKYNGSLVKQGTYFVLVKAKGSDGKTHTIKRDVNILTGVLNDETSTQQP